MDIFQRIRQAGIVPVVIIDHASDAVPTAKALLNGGIDVMEITFRTPAAAKSIEEVAFNCPDLMVGAGMNTPPPDGHLNRPSQTP